MFPVFSVLFRVCSQLKPMKRIAVPSVPSCSTSDYFGKCDWVAWKSSKRNGNTGNSRNDALYQSVALFPVKGRSGNSGNRRSPITLIALSAASRIVSRSAAQIGRPIRSSEVNRIPGHGTPLRQSLYLADCHSVNWRQQKINCNTQKANRIREIGKRQKIFIALRESCCGRPLN